jgi:hypothetical protein
VSSTSISGTGLILNTVKVATAADYVSVVARQLNSRNMNSVPNDATVLVNVVPPSNSFQVSYGTSGQITLYDCSSTVFGINTADIASLTAPQVTITLYYYA